MACGSSVGVEVRRCWERIQLEARQSATWLGEEVPEVLATPVPATETPVAELEEPHVVLGDGVDEVPRGVDLAQGQLVVVLERGSVSQSGSGKKGSI